MPLYEYECEKCGRFEKLQKFSDRAVRKCPTCKGPVEKLLSAPAIQFKGSGWYVTDYAKKSGAPSKDEGKSDKSGKESKSQSSTSDSTSDSSGGESPSSPKKATSTDKAASGSTPTK